jgi:YD repeat-containing protein
VGRGGEFERRERRLHLERAQPAHAGRPQRHAQQLDYAYDAEGNLRTSTHSATGTTRWVTDPNGGAMTRTLARVAPNGDVTRYVYGLGLLYEVRQDG